MKKRTVWTYGIFLAIPEGVGGLASLLTREGMKALQQLEQSALTPPGWIFGAVWAILYALMGIGAARVWLSPPSERRTRGLWLFVFQLIFNFFWNLFFFNMQSFGFSLLWLVGLWVLILGMLLSFRQVDSLAGWLQLPYLAWVAFAGYLNWVIWQRN